MSRLPLIVRLTLTLMAVWEAWSLEGFVVGLLAFCVFASAELGLLLNTIASKRIAALEESLTDTRDAMFEILRRTADCKRRTH